MSLSNREDKSVSLSWCCLCNASVPSTVVTVCGMLCTDWGGSPHHPVEDQASPLTHPPPSTPIFIGFHLFTRWLFIPILINWLCYLLFCFCLGVGSYIAPYNTPLELNIMEWKEIITEIFINIKLLISCWLSSHCQWLRTHLINK